MIIFPHNSVSTSVSSGGGLQHSYVRTVRGYFYSRSISRYVSKSFHRLNSCSFSQSFEISIHKLQ